MAQQECFEEFIDILDEVNGQDAYNTELQAVGSLKPSEYLILPAELKLPIVSEEQVGTKEACKIVEPDYAASVYVLNKGVLKDGSEEDKIKFGLLRMEAVKMGWYENQSEVKFRVTPFGWMTTVHNDMASIKRHVAAAQKAAWLVPFAAEHTFRTLGHYYLRGAAENYSEKYVTLFLAMLAQSVPDYLPHPTLFHTALHWVSPQRVWEVLVKQKDSTRIPKAIRMRFTDGPAETAIITTSASVLRAMRTTSVFEELTTFNVFDIANIFAMDEQIRKDPVKYHRFPSAYGKKGLSTEELEEVRKVKDEVEKAAPITKLFVEVMLEKTDVARQKMLNKPVGNNLILGSQCNKIVQGGGETSFDRRERYKRLREESSSSEEKRGTKPKRRLDSRVYRKMLKKKAHATGIDKGIFHTCNWW